jgi:hypothetical protein
MKAKPNEGGKQKEDGELQHEISFHLIRGLRRRKRPPRRWTRATNSGTELTILTAGAYSPMW